MKATELISIKALAIIIGDVTVTYHFFQHISSFTLWRVINASSGRTWHCLFHMMPWQGLLEYQSRALITLIGKSLLPECSFIESDTFGGISFEAIVVSLRTTVHFLISTRNAWLQSSKLKREGTQPNLKEAKKSLTGWLSFSCSCRAAAESCIEVVSQPLIKRQGACYALAENVLVLGTDVWIGWNLHSEIG